jgi:FKBP-type peptidyl-prolyl cis-trans isomerase
LFYTPEFHEHTTHNGTSSPCSECHYRGTLIDGTEFDSSYSRGKPTTFAPNQVIKGWTEAMQLMKEGDKFELYIPSEMAYGDRQRGQYITPVSYAPFLKMCRKIPT